MTRTRKAVVVATALLAGAVPLVFGGAPALAATAPVAAAPAAAEVGTVVQDGGRLTVPSGTEGPVTLRFTAKPTAGTTGPLTARVELPVTGWPGGGMTDHRLAAMIDSTCSVAGGAFAPCEWDGTSLDEDETGPARVVLDLPVAQAAASIAYAVTLDLPEGLEWIGALDAPVTLKDAAGATVAAGTVGVDVVKGSAYRPYLFGRDRDGVLWTYKGTGDATRPLERKVRVGGGWQQYTAVVPLDETGSNGRGDVVARDRDGVLWFYEGVPNDPATPFKPRVRVGGGWNKYTALVGRDGGLVARDTGGVLWNYVRDAERPAGFDVLFEPRVAVGGGWNAYDALTSLGGGALARDKAGVLWKYERDDYDGSAPARPYEARTKVGGGWQVYTALAGTGDLQGGHPDVVARDAGGQLWLYAGTYRNGSLQPASSRTLVGGGWNAYNLIF
ncbi:hypothetical protein [Streptomyces sp. NPDC014656]|uniref:hypothetical protein n=1 Tax=Streptomyces sp. NPDC014656 TaxID=3364878 RepID=UPI00370078BD